MHRMYTFYSFNFYSAYALILCACICIIYSHRPGATAFIFYFKYKSSYRIVAFVRAFWNLICSCNNNVTLRYVFFTFIAFHLILFFFMSLLLFSCIRFFGQISSQHRCRRFCSRPMSVIIIKMDVLLRSEAITIGERAKRKTIRIDYEE